MKIFIFLILSCFTWKNLQAKTCLKSFIAPKTLTKFHNKEFPHYKNLSWVPIYQQSLSEALTIKTQKLQKMIQKPLFWASVDQRKEGEVYLNFWKFDKKWKFQVGYPMAKKYKRYDKDFDLIFSKKNKVNPFAIYKIEHTGASPHRDILFYFEKEKNCLHIKNVLKLKGQIENQALKIKEELSISKDPNKCTTIGNKPPMIGPGYSKNHFCCEGLKIITSRHYCKQKLAGFTGVCSPCGNNICDRPTETSCNCPEDCPLP